MGLACLYEHRHEHGGQRTIEAFSYKGPHVVTKISFHSPLYCILRFALQLSCHQEGLIEHDVRHTLIWAVFSVLLPASAGKQLQPIIIPTANVV